MDVSYPCSPGGGPWFFSSEKRFPRIDHTCALPLENFFRIIFKDQPLAQAQTSPHVDRSGGSARAARSKNSACRLPGAMSISRWLRRSSFEKRSTSALVRPSGAIKVADHDTSCQLILRTRTLFRRRRTGAPNRLAAPTLRSTNSASRFQAANQQS
jgi:hypothetical protein